MSPKSFPGVSKGKTISIIVTIHNLPFSLSFSQECTVEISRDYLTCNNVITLSPNRMPECACLYFLVFSIAVCLKYQYVHFTEIYVDV